MTQCTLMVTGERTKAQLVTHSLFFKENYAVDNMIMLLQYSPFVCSVQDNLKCAAFRMYYSVKPNLYVNFLLQIYVNSVCFILYILICLYIFILFKKFS